LTKRLHVAHFVHRLDEAGAEERRFGP